MADDVFLWEFSPFTGITAVDGVVAEHQVMPGINADLVVVVQKADWRVS